MRLKINWKLFMTFILISASLTFGDVFQMDQTKRVKFGKGKISAVFSDAVLREEVHYYLVKVREGQTMTVKATSVENNASFRIIKPSGEYIPGAGEMEERKSWSGTLTESGDYKIELASDRGNASYRLTVTVK